jgi:hypothetical protein
VTAGQLGDGETVDEAAFRHDEEMFGRQDADLIAAEDEALARVSEFIREGMRAGRISDESGELLIDAAEAAHRSAVAALRQEPRYLA